MRRGYLWMGVLDTGRRLVQSAVVFAVAVFGAAPAMAETLTGTAMIRERIALPPGATFEAVIEDIARADAPAVALAGVTLNPIGQPPIAFSIDYDPAALGPQAIYALRASIWHEGRLLFSTDTVVHVLAEDSPSHVEIVLQMVSSPDSRAPEPVLGAHGLRLPATFRGTLPCADCEGIRHHLDLWPDQYYHMRREWLGGADGPLTYDEIGRWSADPARGAIVLHEASEMPMFWEVQGPDRLRQMDIEGNPIESSLPYELDSDGTLEPTDLGGLLLTGRMTYMADAALFEECVSGQRYSVAQEGDYLALERAYVDGRAEPGAPLLVHVEGGLARRPSMEGPDRMSLVVDRFIKTMPGEDCPVPVVTASLTETYWRIDSIKGEGVAPMAGGREPHLVLSAGDDRRFRATVGCNQMIGGYETEGDGLAFTPAASTLMACPPPLDAQEQQVQEALGAVRGYRIEGQSLELFDEAGAPLMTLTAVYLY